MAYSFKVTGTSLYHQDSETDLLPIGSTVYLLNYSNISQNSVVTIGKTGRTALVNYLETNKICSYETTENGKINSSTLSYPTLENINIYAVVLSSDSTQNDYYYFTKKITVKLKSGSTVTGLFGSQSTYSQIEAYPSSSDYDAPGWYTVGSGGSLLPIYVNGTQMEHIIVNGVEMTSVYVNGTQIL